MLERGDDLGLREVCGPVQPPADAALTVQHGADVDELFGDVVLQDVEDEIGENVNVTHLPPVEATE